MSTAVAVTPAAVPESGLDISAAWEEALSLPAKARGEVAEMILVPKLMAMGMIVAKPFGDSSPWDLVVQAGNRLSRLQIKSAWVRSAWAKRRGAYQVNASPAMDCAGSRRCYRNDEIDFLVAYVVPEEAWFVIPVGQIRCTNLFIDMGSDSSFARYRDRWDLLFGDKRS